jgi:ABC-type multidrug transport system fused ATPase/permease subunit
MRTLLANGLTPLLQLGIAVALLLVLDWRVSLVVALALFLTTLILRTVLKRATKADYEDKLRDAAVAFTVQDNVEAHLLIRAFGLRDLAVARFAQLLGRRTVSARDYPPWKTTLSAPYFLNRLVGTSTQIQQGFINILS